MICKIEVLEGPNTTFWSLILGSTNLKTVRYCYCLQLEQSCQKPMMISIKSALACGVVEKQYINRVIERTVKNSKHPLDLKQNRSA